MDILKKCEQAYNKKILDWLLYYYLELSRAGQVADEQGLKFIKLEMQRVKKKCLYLESMYS
ncbi:MAG: hypothetical protein SCARUB_01662 [Candidatus Scalindua rubra]|uniref:Uncharacterized protein n=1 Tax=Candidatus Scalindua rubra TaxID=1872076 RepID=A0A1E3XE03_9BACT|nr:MAG: hypothetical protein SCARUB_01662 [Candidatus Scalindua rubra]